MASELKQLGRYLIERVLGKGAMGVVYLARDPVIGRFVALKTLNVPADADEAEEFRQRFLREAEAAGILNHPGIVTVFDAGVDEATGLSFIAMEYVEGKSLKEVLRSGHAFTFSEVARVGSALATALDYAHARGVIHRDIKPANILITNQGAIKITDFGVARLESSNLTAEGQFIGTPNYMSPEQVGGTPVDGRSDLFSLGVVVFELLTGTRPFGGNSLTEVSYKIVHEAPPIPSHLRPGLPPAFNPILLKLLEKEPGRRYQKGADIARALDALRRVLAGASADSGTAAPSATGSGVAKRTVSAAHTATRATTIEEQVPEVPPPAPSIWRLPIESRWIITVVGAALLIPGAIIAVLLSFVERGPVVAADVGEAARRHRVVVALAAAEQALAAGNPAEVERLLADVWDQAPYTSRGRDLLARARSAKESMQTQVARSEQVRRLREEGQGLLREGRLEEAQARFEDALALDPDDTLAQKYLNLARERGRSAAAMAVATPIAPRRVATPAPVPAQARLELYFNCPISEGSIEVELDGRRLAEKPFNFTTRGMLGIKKKGAGVIQDAYAIEAGSYRITVRLRGEDGRLRGEETLPASFVAGSRWVLKIEMAGEQDVPRFTLTHTRGRG